MGMVSDTESAMLRKVIVRALLITVPAVLVPLFFTGRAIHGKPGPRFALKAEIDSEPHAPAQSQPDISVLNYGIDFLATTVKSALSLRSSE